MTECEKQITEMQLEKAKEVLKEVRTYLDSISVPGSMGLGLKVNLVINMLEV